MPDQSASSALRMTSVYQRSKSSDILVMSLTNVFCSSRSCFMPIAPCSYACSVSKGRSGPRESGLARERGRRRSVLGRDLIDLGEEHGEKLFLWHGAVK